MHILARANGRVLAVDRFQWDKNCVLIYLKWDGKTALIRIIDGRWTVLADLSPTNNSDRT